MPSLLESGMLQLSSQEAETYRPAADHLHESCRILVDLATPLTVEQWLLLCLASAALSGDLEPLCDVIAKVEAELALRKLPS